jgi:hypothetical protein
MPLCLSLPATEERKHLASIFAALLKGKTKIPAEEQGTELFDLWTEECRKLVKEFAKAEVM